MGFQAEIRVEVRRVDARTNGRIHGLAETGASRRPGFQDEANMRDGNQQLGGLHALHCPASYARAPAFPPLSYVRELPFPTSARLPSPRSLSPLLPAKSPLNQKKEGPLRGGVKAPQRGAPVMQTCGASVARPRRPLLAGV